MPPRRLEPESVIADVGVTLTLPPRRAPLRMPTLRSGDNCFHSRRVVCHHGSQISRGCFQRTGVAGDSKELTLEKICDNNNGWTDKQRLNQLTCSLVALVYHVRLESGL